ncbi:TetR/AcrR family transcriptional regulator [Lacrimispora sp.]|uniref:TetR/AcrR family transcriptional regulator n=1 Tax=Lacrimispora sp. TaxID=2719234 RepID=UPI0039937E54
MGKAFTDKERADVQGTLRRIGLKLFAEKGIKGVSIRDLTSEAGIAQGSFYTFYKDKEDFLIDLIKLRITEKLAIMIEKKADSLNDPVGYIAEIFYQEGMHLKENKAFDNMISGTLELFYNAEPEVNERISNHYKDAFETMIQFWREHGYRVDADIDALMNTIRAASILFSNAHLISDKYFKDIYKIFCVSEINAFLKVRK